MSVDTPAAPGAAPPSGVAAAAAGVAAAPNGVAAAAAGVAAADDTAGLAPNVDCGTVGFANEFVAGLPIGDVPKRDDNEVETQIRQQRPPMKNRDTFQGISRDGNG